MSQYYYLLNLEYQSHDRIDNSDNLVSVHPTMMIENCWDFFDVGYSHDILGRQVFKLHATFKLILRYDWDLLMQSIRLDDGAILVFCRYHPDLHAHYRCHAKKKKLHLNH
mmetsp:Transcript_24144/g.41339  ORF Transcript_24144/g.41339 Transcript_24144/m.41339 type:complete len:110 (+) Transcript_24144:351-680(+)